MAKNIKRRDFITSGLVAQNRRANFDYQIDEKFTAGLELAGTEVKSLRLGHANINDAYGIIKGNELYISNMYIAEYANRGYESHIEKRDRKLLLQRRELAKLERALQDKGLTIVGLKLFINDKGLAKLQIGLGRGRKSYDKREYIKEKDARRELERVFRK